MFCFKDDLCEKMKENNKQQEEIIHLKQENVVLKNELALNGKCRQLAFQALTFNRSEPSRWQQFTGIWGRQLSWHLIKVDALLCYSVKAVPRTSAGTVYKTL